MLGLNDKECYTYTSYIVKDYGVFEKHIVFKNNVKKSGYEENEEFKDGKIQVNADKLKYDSLSAIDKDLYDKGFFELEELDIKNKKINKMRSKRRSKEKVFNMCILNEWDYFITLTFSKDKVKDRYDLEELKKTTLLYFKRLQKNHGIKYLLIPELHKDGALHWHGLIRDTNNKVKMVSANTTSCSNREVFNICSWSDNKGFNTAVKIDKDDLSRSKVSSYISKYITKGNKLFRNYYYCSKDLLNEPKILYDEKMDINFFLDDGTIFENDFCYIKTVYKNDGDK